MKKNNIFKFVLLVITSSFSITNIKAQEANSLYFLNGSVLRHESNPAFINEYNYISLPIIGNTNINIGANVGLGNFFLSTNKDNTPVLFMNKNIDAKQFLNQLPQICKGSQEMNFNTLSFGFKTKKGYITIGTKTCATFRQSIPKELFSFLKEGMKDEGQNIYDIKNLSVNKSIYENLNIGYAHKINEKWTIGTKINFLFGIQHSNININHIHLDLSEDRWNISAKDMLLSMTSAIDLKTKGETGNYSKYDYKTKNGEKTPELRDGVQEEIDFGSIKLNQKKPVEFNVNGLGLSLDFGTVYRPMDDLELSLSILNIGGINWHGSKTARMNSEYSYIGGKIKYEKETEQSDSNNDIQENLKIFSHFKKSEDKDFELMPTKWNFGVNYTMPFYKGLKTGLLLHSTTHKELSDWGAMLSLNIEPTNWFGMNINYDYSTYGSSAGGAIVFHPRWFNLFLSAQLPLTTINKDFVPIKKTGLFGVNMGINIAF